MLQSTAYSFSLVLGWLLIGDAAGIIVGVFAVGCAPNPERFFLWLQGAVTLYSSIALWLIAWAHRWPAVSDRFIGYNYNLRPHLTAGDVTVVLVVISVAVLPPAVLLGMSFPVTQKAIQDDPALVGQRVGLIQVFNILANTAGAIVTGLVLMQVLGTPGSIRLLALLGLLFTLVLLADGHRRVIRPLLQLAHSSLAGGLAVVLVTFFLVAPTRSQVRQRRHCRRGPDRDHAPEPRHTDHGAALHRRARTEQCAVRPNPCWGSSAS
jgi:spermidine synthase